MNNTLVSLKGVSRGQRGPPKVSERKKMAISQHVFPPNIYLPGSTRKPTAERHVTLKEKRIKINLPFQRNKGVPLVTFSN